MAKCADRTPAHIPVHTQTHTIAIPTFTPNKNRLVLSLSTVCQSDKTGDGNARCTRMKGIPQQNRNSWASNSCTTEKPKAKTVQWANSLHSGEDKMVKQFRRTAVFKTRGVGTAGWTASYMTVAKYFYHKPSVGIRSRWQLKEIINPTPKGLTSRKSNSLTPTGSKIIIVSFFFFFFGPW